jgi:hypothetical protein
MKLPEPDADGRPSSKAGDTGILIWGAGSAVGGYGIYQGIYLVAMVRTIRSYSVSEKIIRQQMGASERRAVIRALHACNRITLAR